ncbi:unnamed protein product, partial [Chrysoparadoxa australica]
VSRDIRRRNTTAVLSSCFVLLGAIIAAADASFLATALALFGWIVQLMGLCVAWDPTETNAKVLAGVHDADGEVKRDLKAQTVDLVKAQTESQVASVHGHAAASATDDRLEAVEKGEALLHKEEHSVPAPSPAPAPACLIDEAEAETVAEAEDAVESTKDADGSDDEGLTAIRNSRNLPSDLSFDEKVSQNYFADLAGQLLTPLQQAVAAVELVATKYAKIEGVRRNLEKVLDILAQPDNLNSITIKSIERLAPDNSTSDWIQSNLSPSTQAHPGRSPEENWRVLRIKTMALNRFRLKAQAIRERSDSKPKPVVMKGGGGITSLQLEHQQHVADIYQRNKKERKQRESNFNMTDLAAIGSSKPAERAMGAVSEEPCESNDEDEESEDENVRVEKFVPVYIGIDPEMQNAVLELHKARGFLDWDFDVFRLQECSGGHAMWYAAMFVFNRYNFIGVFSIPPVKLNNFLVHVESNYCYNPAEPNPYHTSLHAADVTLTVAHVLGNRMISENIRALQGFALCLSAVVHDYRHLGYNNGFLTKTGHELAIVYNDTSVLENFHAAETFRLLSSDECSILEGFSEEDYKYVRQLILRVILATDLAHGFEYVGRFQAALNSAGGRRASQLCAKRGSSHQNKGEAQLLIMQMVIKFADVAHPMRNWSLHR